MRAGRVIVAGVAAVGAALPVGLPARAAAPALSITVSPADLTLLPGASQKVVVLLRNDGDAPVTLTALDVVAPTGITVTDLTAPSTLAPGSTSAIEPSVALAGGSLGGTVTLVGRYTAGGAGEVATGTLAVHPETAVSAATVLSLDLHSNLPSLDETTSGVIILLIHNMTSGTLTVKSVAVSTGTAELHVDPVDGRQPPSFTVDPYDTRSLVYAATVHGRTKPGKQMVVFDVAATAPALAGLTLHAQTTQPVDLQVFGGAEVAGALSAPSLLVLPGVIFFVTLGYVLKRISWVDATAIPDAPSIPFWVLAVSLSLLAVQIAAWITGRVLFDRYDFGDILLVWAGSLLAAVVAAAAWAAIAWVWRRQHEPMPGDSALDVLRKIARTGGHLHLPYCVVPTVSSHRLAELDFKVAGGAGGRWMAPRIRVPVAAHDSGAIIAAVDRRDPKALVTEIENRELTPVWSVDGTWPVLVDAAAITADGTDQELIDVAVR